MNTSDDTGRLRVVFLRALIDGAVEVSDTTGSRAAALGIDLTAPLGLVLLIDARVGGQDEPERFEERALQVARAPWGTATTIVLDPDPNLPPAAAVLVPSFDWGESAVCESLADACRAADLVAVWAAAPGVGRVPVLWGRLRRLLPVAERASRWQGPVMALDAVFPYWLAASLPEHEVDDLLVSEVGPLMRESEQAESRVETWKLLLRDRPTLVDAANTLGVAESTVGKRRAAIEALTKRLRGQETFRAHLASYLLELLDGDLDPPGDPWWEGGDA